VPDPEYVQLLKSDVFGRIRRVGNVVVREADHARPWARALARHLMRREHRALSRLALGAGIEGIPRVVDLDDLKLTRSWIEGAPMQSAKPRDPAYFRAASRLLRRLHAANVIHNDLAKGNELARDSRWPPRLVDFQLAMTSTSAAHSPARWDTTTCATCSSTNAPIFRRRLTAREKRILAEAVSGLENLDGDWQEGVPVRHAQDPALAGSRGRGRSRRQLPMSNSAFRYPAPGCSAVSSARAERARTCAPRI
jgi:hypothetical protein